ncbi:MAG: hypothetical protein IJ723_01845, partial [Ruminococcus sp.]|nr:hypothetical protein [Ruminococcus sp.]
LPADEKSIVIGNIRMGFGLYRISMAIASAANSMGITPYWFDLNSFNGTTATSIISAQNDLYSLGSRISQKSFLFNKFVWEPINSEGFRKLTYNCSDQMMTELMTALYNDLPKDIPFAATHVWPAQGAVHAGLTNVVNVVPDNWPMALHLAEGSVHTVQTQSSYLGYKVLRGMDKKRMLEPMPDSSIEYTGHYIDHELVSNIEADCARRIDRLERKKAKRYLLTIGGAGAQQDIFVSIIKRLLPEIKKEKAVLFVNLGDHYDAWNNIRSKLPSLGSYVTEHIDNFDDTAAFANLALDGDVSGIHVFCHKDIFAAVYSTNLLMRACDVLVTKPSELAFYPVPKLMIKRVGGHEAWGAVRAAEIGDGTFECETPLEIAGMLRSIQNEDGILRFMCDNIVKAKQQGVYDGAYKAVELAMCK